MARYCEFCGNNLEITNCGCHAASIGSVKQSGATMPSTSRGNFPVSDKFTFDPSSGLYYLVMPGNDETGQCGNWVTWFYPETGKYEQYFTSDAPKATFSAASAHNPVKRAARGNASTKREKKKPAVLVAAISLAVLVIAAGAYFIWSSNSGDSDPTGSIADRNTTTIGDADFTSTLPVSASGNNLIGNSMENLQNGGFITAQGNDVFFVNFEDGGTLYCYDRNGGLTKLTDFPVANLNIRGNTLFFTDLTSSSFVNMAGQTQYVQARAHQEIWDLAGSKHGISYGGNLYAINGIRSYCEGVISVEDIEQYVFDTGYEGVQQLVFAETGLLMIPVGSNGINADGLSSAGSRDMLLAATTLAYSGDAVAASQLSAHGNSRDRLVYICTIGCNELIREIRVTENEHESIVNFVVCDGFVFVQLLNEQTGEGRILKYSLQTGMNTFQTEGRNLRTWLGSPVFQSHVDDLLYLWDVQTDTFECISSLQPIGRLFTGRNYPELRDTRQGLSFFARIDDGARRMVHLVAVPDSTAENWMPPPPFEFASEDSFPVESRGVTVFALTLPQSGSIVITPVLPDCSKEDECDCVEKCDCDDECGCPHCTVTQEVGDDTLYFRGGRGRWRPARNPENGDETQNGTSTPEKRDPPELPPENGEKKDDKQWQPDGVYAEHIIEFIYGPTPGFNGDGDREGAGGGNEVDNEVSNEVGNEVGNGGDNGGIIAGNPGSDEACPTGWIYHHPEPLRGGTMYQYWLLPNGTYYYMSMGDASSPVTADDARAGLENAVRMAAENNWNPDGSYEISGNTITLTEHGSVGLIGRGTIAADGSMAMRFEDRGGTLRFEKTLVRFTCGGALPANVPGLPTQAPESELDGRYHQIYFPLQYVEFRGGYITISLTGGEANVQGPYEFGINEYGEDIIIIINESGVNQPRGGEVIFRFYHSENRLILNNSEYYR